MLLYIHHSVRSHQHCTELFQLIKLKNVSVQNMPVFSANSYFGGKFSRAEVNQKESGGLRISINRIIIILNMYPSNKIDWIKITCTHVVYSKSRTYLQYWNMGFSWYPSIEPLSQVCRFRSWFTDIWREVSPQHLCTSFSHLNPQRVESKLFWPKWSHISK